MSSHRHDCLLFGAPAGLGTEQHCATPLHRFVIGLKAHPSPCQFNQCSAQTAVTMLSNCTTLLLIATSPHSWTHAGQAGHLAPILKAFPTQNFPFQNLAG